MKKCAILFCVLIITLILAVVTERNAEAEKTEALVQATNQTELIAETTDNIP